MRKRKEPRFLPADDEWPELRENYVTLIRAGYSSVEASEMIVNAWLNNRKKSDNEALELGK